MKSLLFLGLGFGLNVLANDKELREKVFSGVKDFGVQVMKEVNGGK